VYATITLDPLHKTADRDDFSVRVVGPGDTYYRFRLSATRTVLAIWQTASADEAVAALAETLVESHGTASAFPEQGFWFDSYNSAETASETCNIIRNRGWTAFLHPAARTSLGAALFSVLDELDAAFSAHHGRPFLKSLDILFEPSQALEDLETDAHDNPHFIYRVCILSAVIDRFAFDEGNGSLNGLRAWLEPEVGAGEAAELTSTFQMVKRLRKQYPIHEHFEVDAAGERHRRAQIVEAEQYFELRANPSEDWRRVLTRFIKATQRLTRVVASTSPVDVTRSGTSNANDCI